MELDLLTPMALIQTLLPGLRDRRGAVVNVASSAGVDTTAYGSPELRGGHSWADPAHHIGCRLARAIRRSCELRRSGIGRAWAGL